MRTSAIVLSLAAILGAVPAAMAAQSPQGDLAGLINQFKAASAQGAARTPAQLDASCAAIVAAAAPVLEADDMNVRTQGKTAIEGLAFFVSRPGAEPERLALSKAVAARIGTARQPAKVWMCRVLQYIGRTECVAALAALLSDADAEVGESARRALQKNPSPEAGSTLLAALARADKAPWRLAMVNAVCDRADPAAGPAITRLLADKDEGVAMAAAYGLGKIGGTDALKALTAAKATATGQKLQDAVLDAIVMCAADLVRQGKLDEAGAAYRDLDVAGISPRIRMAALRGTIIAGGDKALPTLTASLTGTNPAMRNFALSLLGEVRGAAGTQALIALMPKLAPPEQVVLLTELSTRTDAAVKPAIVEALKSPDEGVRTAAARAMGTLGDASDVPLLAPIAAAGGAKSAALDTLIGLRGSGVSASIVQALGAADAKTRAVLLRALAARRAAEAMPAVLKAAADADEGVRTEAALALGALADASAVPTLVAMVVKAQTDGERQAAEKAVSAISGRTPSKESAAAPILSALPAAQGQVRVSLIAMLSSAGTPAALAAVRAALKDADPQVQQAAIRTLGDWPDAGPAADLLAIASTDPAPARQVLALRGFVRLAGLGERPAADRVKMYQDALAAAKQPEKKMVLAEMAKVPCAPAMAAALPLLTDPDVKNEAAAAITKIALATAGSDPEEAQAALQKVIASSADEVVKQQAREALSAISKNAEFITAWLLSGPYQQEGKGATELFDVAFAPEGADPSKAKWMALPAQALSGDRPGVVDFDKTPAGGGQTVAYLRTAIWSPSAQAAVLELGSDDGAKVFLNGKVILTENAVRGLAVGQNKVNVTLARGWNTLMLKITNEGGGFEAVARIVGADARPLQGLRFRATAEAPTAPPAAK